MNNLYDKILPYLDKLKSVRPTIWGQVMLSAYPEEVVLHADNVTINCKKLQTNMERWKYLCSVAKTYCQQNEIEIEWRLVFDEAKQMGMPREPLYFDEKFIPILAIKKPILNVNTPKASSKNIDPYQHNQDIIKRWGPQIQEESVKKMTHEEEWEWTRINEPEKFARWEANAKQFRSILGLNEDGTFQPGRSPEQAVEVLMNIFTP